MKQDSDLNQRKDSITDKPFYSEPIEISLPAALEKIDELEARVAELKEWRELLKNDGIHLVRMNIDDIFEALADIDSQIAILSGRPNAGNKQKERMKKLDEFLLSRQNSSASFTEIGKHLELGSKSSDGRKNTRKQNMRLFSFVLARYPQKYIIERKNPSNTYSPKRVRLHPDWRRSLLIKRENAKLR